jgi:hypothetical protein
MTQVKDPNYIYDALRYIILISYTQESYDVMMDTFRRLLQEKKTTPADYVLLFDMVFYEPYRNRQTHGATLNLSEKYALSVVIPYIDSCRKVIASSLPYVCKYGEA